MLSLQECLDFADIDHSMIEAIAESECLPLIVAAELGYNMMNCDHGLEDVLLLIKNGMERAVVEGRLDHAAHLAQIYKNLQTTCHKEPVSADVHGG